jgi:hypothetical protein
MESCWQLAAKKRWPRSQIQGDGPFAFSSACCRDGVVVLFWFAAQAMEAVHEKCPHAFCRGNAGHGAFQLQPAKQQQQAYQPAHAAGYGRD